MEIYLKLDEKDVIDIGVMLQQYADGYTNTTDKCHERVEQIRGALDIAVSNKKVARDNEMSVVCYKLPNGEYGVPIDEFNRAISEIANEKTKIKRSAEKCLQQLLEDKIIKGWYFNETFNVEKR